MRNNVFIKSIYRQPMRLALLFVLIALAAFAFVLRTVEFMVVRNQIHEISEYYQTRGFVNHPEWFGDVSGGIEILTQSPLIGFEDGRRAAQAILHDTLNADVTGTELRVSTFRQRRVDSPVITEAYFYGYLESIACIDDGSFDSVGAYRLTIMVDRVIVGHPEYIIEGQRVFLEYRPQIYEVMGHRPLANMQTGTRFFLRAAYFQSNAVFGPVIPRAGDPQNILRIWPLYDSRNFRENIWYAPVPTGQYMDFSHPQFAHIPDEIEMLRRSQRSIQLQSTKDMSEIPNIDQVLQITSGRLLNYDDHANANQVIVINEIFARMRGISVGDTLPMSIPLAQNYFGRIGINVYFAPHIRVDRNHPDRYLDAIEVELEVVGIYRFGGFSSSGAQTLFAFVPDSVLPAGLSIEWAQRVFAGGEWRYLSSINFGEEHRPDAWYSFALGDSRNEMEFIQNFHHAIAALGFDLVVFNSDSSFFWASAEPILLSIMFNAVLFWVVLVLVLALVAFLYLKQRQRDFAVMRALGVPSGKIFAGLALSVLLFALPAAAVGGSTAWFFALNEAAGTLADFESAYAEARPPSGFELAWEMFFGDRPLPYNLDETRNVNVTAALPMYWLIILPAITLAVVMVMILAGGKKALSRPVLELLQGNSVKPAKEFAGKAAWVPLGSLPISAAPRWVLCHILRSPAKTTLSLLCTLFFIGALGWLNESVIRTNDEIDFMYDNIIVRAEIVPNYRAALEHLAVHMIQTQFGNMGGDMRPAPGQHINPLSVSRILDSGFVHSYYQEFVYFRSFLNNPVRGTLDRFWEGDIMFVASTPRTYIPFSFNYRRMDFLLSTNDLEAFMQRHTVAQTNLNLLGFVHNDDTGGMMDVRIDFASGFDITAFDEAHHMNGEAIPIIVSPRTMQRRNLILGEETLLAYFLLNSRWPEYTRVRVVGVHNSHIHMSDMGNAVLIPGWAAEDLMGFLLRPATFNFSINPAYNRNLSYVRTGLERIMTMGDPLGIPPSVLQFHDRELRVVIGSLEQSLLLLSLLYPVAISTAIAIGGGLAMLIVLQNAKNAAIMRVLGTSRKKTALTLWSEQIVICLLGLVIGLVAMAISGWSLAGMFLLSSMYLGGVMLGSLAGSLLVTRRAPLDLLQVRE